MTDDLTTALSHIPGAFVISRATANTYRGKAEDIRTIGRDLNVRYVVRGGIRRFGQVLRVNAELGSTESGGQLWSDTFDQKIEDLAAGQEQIVTRMRGALDISLAEIEASRGLRERPTNADAFDLILQARAIVLLPTTKENGTKALGLYEQALVRDPNSVIALAGAINMVLEAFFLGAMPYDSAMPRALQYLERAQKLEPNAESVLVAQSTVLDFQLQELDYRRVRTELRATGQKLIDLYPNNYIGYFRLGGLARNEQRFEDAAGHFAKTIHLNPRWRSIKTLYWNMAYSTIYAGRDREGLDWVDRTMGAEGSLPAFRSVYLNMLRAVAYARTGNLEAAKRIIKQVTDQEPFWTWRDRYPDDPDSETNRVQVRSFMEALRVAGMRDHVDPDANFGVPPEDVLHLEFAGKTPTTTPGATTVGTEELAGMLRDKKPLVIDTMANSWFRSVPGAIGLDFHDNTHGDVHRPRSGTIGEEAAPVDRQRHDETDRCLRLERGQLRWLQPCAAHPSRGLHGCLLVSRRPPGLGGSWQARRSGAAGRLVAPRQRNPLQLTTELRHCPNHYSLTRPPIYVPVLFMLDAPTAASPETQPSRVGRLLALVRRLIDYGRDLAAKVQRCAIPPPTSATSIPATYR